MYKNILETIFGVRLIVGIKFMKVKNTVKVLVFLSILCIIFVLCEKVLTAKWIYEPRNEIIDHASETNRYESFYKLQDNTLDYIVLGVSHSYYSINPMLIYAQTGYAGYDLGSPVQPIEVSYQWLQEACKYQTPKYVFYDVGSLFYDDEDIDKWAIIKALTYMKPSVNIFK